MAAQDWNQYWKGRRDVGERFAGEGIERHQALERHWRAVLAEAPDGTVLDIAAGAGAIAKIAVGAGRATRAVDISVEAMDLLTSQHPSIECVTAGAEELPFADGSHAVTVSQFGLEYAEPKAFAEAMRVTAPGGFFRALCHYRGGAIQEEVKTHRAEADNLLSSGLFDAATALTEALFRGEFERQKVAYQRAEAAAAQKMSPVAEKTIAGFRRLASRHMAYDKADILGWLGAMRGEAEAYAGRMAAMEDAALDEAEARARLDLLAGAGGERLTLEPFTLEEGERPSAWLITARKAA